MARRPEFPRGAVASPSSLGDGGPPARRGIDASARRVRGRYFTIPQVVDAYPGVLTERLIRRLVAERRIAFTYAGRRIVLAEADIEAYLESNRHEPAQRWSPGRARPA